MNSFALNIINSVAVLSFDSPDRKVNILTFEVMDELEGIIGELGGMGADLKGVIFISAKERNFVAGADLSLIQGIADPVEGAAMARKGQEIFSRIAALSCKTVAAIHGSCLGGGLELALACDHRVASDSADTFMGFPETQLGILPGFGGTQRLPRIVDIPEAVRMITTGSSVHPLKALRSGLVDEITKREYLMDAALATVSGNLPTPRKKRTGAAGMIQKILSSNRFGRRMIFGKARKAVLERTRGNYPAPMSAIDAMEYGLNRGLERGLKKESLLFGELAATQTCKNLLNVFLLRERFAKGDPAPAKGIENLAVIGAGVMGAGIATLAAERGLRVRLIDMSEKAIGAAIRSLDRDVKEKRRKGRFTRVAADWIPTRLTVDTQIRGIGRSDVVIEAVAERIQIKRSVLASVAGEVPASAMILTNTSSLPVTEMAAGIPEPGRFGGFHFFNPVDRMPLVEVIRGDLTSAETVERLVSFARKLGKVPIVVKDSPGFLVNRLLLPYLNEACFLLQAGADMEEIDRALLEFGLPMGAFILLDQVGLDIVEHAAGSMLDGFGDRMTPSPVLGTLVRSGRLGKKTGKGFYRYDQAGNRRTDPETRKLLEPHLGGKGNFTSNQIVERLVYPMINEASLCLEEGVVDSADTVDTAMILGAGFPPFTGGLLRYADHVGAAQVAAVLRKLSMEVDGRFAPSESMVKMAEMGGVFHP